MKDRESERIKRKSEAVRAHVQAPVSYHYGFGVFLLFCVKVSRLAETSRIRAARFLRGPTKEIAEDRSSSGKARRNGNGGI